MVCRRGVGHTGTPSDLAQAEAAGAAFGDELGRGRPQCARQVAMVIGVGHRRGSCAGSAADVTVWLVDTGKIDLYGVILPASSRRQSPEDRSPPCSPPPPLPPLVRR